MPVQRPWLWPWCGHPYCMCAITTGECDALPLWRGVCASIVAADRTPTARLYRLLAAPPLASVLDRRR